jgi:hypothetical protein
LHYFHYSSVTPRYSHYDWPDIQLPLQTDADLPSPYLDRIVMGDACAEQEWLHVIKAIAKAPVNAITLFLSK